MNLTEMDFKTWMCWIITTISLFSKTNVANATQKESSPHLIPCKEGWFLFGEKCYKVLGKDVGLKWKQASTTCLLESATLATIDSQKLQKFLTAFILLDVRSSIWIGLHDRESESLYEWVDGSLVTFTNWEPDEPSGRRRPEEDCVEMRFFSRGKVGMWNDRSCDTTLPFICQSEKSNVASSQDPRFCSMDIGGGWKYLNSCYHTVEEEKSWEDAEKYCQDTFNGHLLTVLDSREELFLNYILSNSNEEFWIGIKIREQVAQKWSSGWYVNYNRWKKDTHFANGTCSIMAWQNLWSTVPCFQQHSFVCETSQDNPVSIQAFEGWSCPNTSKDWKDLNGDTCYIFETSKSLKWHEANFYCMNKGGTLASIHSEVESNALNTHIINSQDAVLIGLHRSLTNKSIFEWVDGTNVDYTNWRAGEPNSIAEECGEVWPDTMEWNDGSCDSAKRYICSAKKRPPITKIENESVISECLQQKDSEDKKDTSTSIILGTSVGILLFSFITYIGIRYFRKSRKSEKKLSLKEFCQPDTISKHADSFEEQDPKELDYARL